MSLKEKIREELFLVRDENTGKDRKLVNEMLKDLEDLDMRNGAVWHISYGVNGFNGWARYSTDDARQAGLSGGNVFKGSLKRALGTIGGRIRHMSEYEGEVMKLKYEVSLQLGGISHELDSDTYEHLHSDEFRDYLEAADDILFGYLDD